MIFVYTMELNGHFQKYYSLDVIGDNLHHQVRLSNWSVHIFKV